MRLLPVAFAALLLSAAPLMAQTKIAVANPVEILNALEETKELNKGMETERLKAQSEGQAMVAKVKDLQTQRDLLKPDAPQWAELNKQFVAQRNELQAWNEKIQAELLKKFRDQAKKMNEKITKAVDEVAKAKGFDLVLAEQRIDASEQQMDQMNQQQIMGVLFSSRNVLFKKDEINLTQEVIKKLDADYKAGK